MDIRNHMAYLYNVSEREAVELFHLFFLRALFASTADKRLVAVKGGCNLRFFFGSVRYSEDLDLDVKVTARTTLEAKVDRLLASPTLTKPLLSHGVSLGTVSKPKQTDTTQRWKLGLTHRAGQAHTKVEFSRRGTLDGTSFDAVSDGIVRQHRIQPFLASHYALVGAVAQKIEALAGRSTPQARDVFDLGLLFAIAGATTPAIEMGARARIDAAISNAEALSFDDYVGQVVAFLEPDQAALHDSRETWELQKQTVIARLGSLR